MSGRKNNLVTYTTLSAGDMTGNLTSAVTDVRWLDNLVFYITFTGTPTGTFAIEVSPDQSVWYALDLSPSPTATGTNGSHRISLHQLPDCYIRGTYTATSGSGTCKMLIAGKML